MATTQQDFTAALGSQDLTFNDTKLSPLFDELRSAADATATTDATDTTSPESTLKQQIEKITTAIRIHFPKSVDEAKALELEKLLRDLGVSEPVTLKALEGKDKFVAVAKEYKTIADTKYAAVSEKMVEVKDVVSEKVEVVKEKVTPIVNDQIDKVKTQLEPHLEVAKESISKTIQANPALSNVVDQVTPTVLELQNKLQNVANQPLSTTVSSLWSSASYWASESLSALSKSTDENETPIAKLHKAILGTLQTTSASLNDKSQAVVTVFLKNVESVTELKGVKEIKEKAVDVVVGPGVKILESSYEVVKSAAQNPQATLEVLTKPITKLIVHSSGADGEDHVALENNPVVTYLVNLSREMNKQISLGKEKMVEPAIEWVKDSKVGDVVFMVVGGDDAAEKKDVDVKEE